MSSNIEELSNWTRGPVSSCSCWLSPNDAPPPPPPVPPVCPPVPPVKPPVPPVDPPVNPPVPPVDPVPPWAIRLELIAMRVMLTVKPTSLAWRVRESAKGLVDINLIFMAPLRFWKNSWLRTGRKMGGKGTNPIVSEGLAPPVFRISFPLYQTPYPLLSIGWIDLSEYSGFAEPV